MSKTRNSTKAAAEEALPPLSRSLRVDDIEDGETYATEATRSELAAVAKLLDLVALETLRFHGSFHFAGEGRLLLDGTLTAQVTQTCVVSLEPVENAIEARVEVEFWPQGRIDALAATVGEAASHSLTDWPEPIVDGRIELGPVLYETLATALDPYPRREGVQFEWTERQEGAGAESPADNPFSALSRLKRG